MSNVLSMIAKLGEATIEAAGLEWKIRKLSPAEFMEAGMGALMMLPEDAVVAAVKGKAAVVEDAEESAADAIKMIAQMDARTVGKLTKAKEIVACMAIIGVRPLPDGAWEPVTFLMDRNRQQESDSRLWVGNLPPEVVDLVFGKAMEISGHKGAADRLIRFRERSESVESTG